ncbi:MAG: hypothetical protein R3A79_14835 [Nannocystaceae bacterium]
MIDALLLGAALLLDAPVDADAGATLSAPKDAHVDARLDAPTYAQTDPPGASPRRIAVAVDRGDALTSEALAATLRGHLADLEIDAAVVDRAADEDLGERIAWAREAAQGGAEAVFWVEPAPAQEHATLFLFARAGGGERLYKRRLTLPDEPLERQEILGVVIRGLASGLDAREPPPDMEELAIPAAAPTAAPPASDRDIPEETGGEAATPRPRRLLLGLGYAGSSFAADLPWAHGVGVDVGLLTRRGLVVAGELTWALHSPLTPTLAGAVYADARLRLSRASLGLRLGYRARFGGRLFFEPAVVVRGEAAIWWPLPDSRAQRGAGARLAVGPSVTAGVALGRGRNLALIARAGLDLWLRNLDLVATSASGAVTIARPPVAGASVLAGLQYAR